MNFKQVIFPLIRTKAGFFVEMRLNYHSMVADPLLTPADHLDFYQSDQTKVLYINERLTVKGGFTPTAKKRSKEDGQLMPDARTIQLADSFFYSGKDGTGGLIGKTYLMHSSGSFLSMCFDDPKYINTIFLSQVLPATAGVYNGGSAYVLNDVVTFTQGSDTDTWQARTAVPPGNPPGVENSYWGRARHTYFIGDIEIATVSAKFFIIYAERSLNALQPQIISMVAEPAARRLTHKLVKDFLSAVKDWGGAGTYGLLNGPYPFYAGYQPIPGFKLTPGKVVPLPDSASTPTAHVAGHSINMRLHLIFWSDILQAVAKAAHYTFDPSTDVTTAMQAYKDQYFVLGGPNGYHTQQITGDQFAKIGLCYELAFGIDIRGNQNAFEYNTPISHAWNNPMGDIVHEACGIYGCYLKWEVDQALKQPKMRLLNRRDSTGSALPAAPTFQLMPGSGLKDRQVSAPHVEVSCRNDDDKVTCPNDKANAISIEIGRRTKIRGRVGQDCQLEDMIYDTKIDQDSQESTWSLLTGGYNNGMHVVGDDSVINTGTPQFQMTSASSDLSYVSLITAPVPDNICFPNHPPSKADSIISNTTIQFAGGYSPIGYGTGRFAIGYDWFGTSGSCTTPTATILDDANCDFTGHVGKQIILLDCGVYTIMSATGSGPWHATLDRSFTPPAQTNIEFRIGGPEINGNGWHVGSYLYFFSDLLFGANLYFNGNYDNLSKGVNHSDWTGAFTVNGWEYRGGATRSSFGYGSILRTLAQFNAAELLGNPIEGFRSYYGCLGADGLLTSYGLLDTFTEQMGGRTATFIVDQIDVDEFENTVHIAHVEAPDANPIDDVHYPVLTSGGSNSSGGSSGGAGTGASSSSTVDTGSALVKGPNVVLRNRTKATAAGVPGISVAAFGTDDLYQGYLADDTTKVFAVDYLGNVTGPAVIGTTQWLGATVAVAHGGTGATSFTSNGVLYGNAGGTLQVTAQGAAGTVLHGNGGAPTFTQIVNADIANVTIDLTTKVTGLLPVANGGTGAATLTNHGVLVGHGTAAVSALATLTNGQLLIGSTGNDPSLATLTAGTGISVTNGAGTITIANTAVPATDYVKTDPSTTATNTVQPTVDSVDALTLKRHSSNTSGSMLQIRDESANTMVAVTGSGLLQANQGATVGSATNFGSPKLGVGGPIGTDTRTLTANTTLDATYSFVNGDTTSGSFTITLPSGSLWKGVEFIIMKFVAANTLSLASTDGINGTSPMTASGRYFSWYVKHNGTTWVLI